MLPAKPWTYIQNQPLFITSTADLISCLGISSSHLTGLPVSELAHLQSSLKKAVGEIQLKYKSDQIISLPSIFGGFPCHFWVKAKFIKTQPYKAWHNPDPSAFWTVSHPWWLHSSPRGPAAPHTTLNGSLLPRIYVFLLHLLQTFTWIPLTFSASLPWSPPPKVCICTDMCTCAFFSHRKAEKMFNCARID